MNSLAGKCGGNAAGEYKSVANVIHVDMHQRRNNIAVASRLSQGLDYLEVSTFLLGAAAGLYLSAQAKSLTVV